MGPGWPGAIVSTLWYALLTLALLLRHPRRGGFVLLMLVLMACVAVALWFGIRLAL